MELPAVYEAADQTSRGGQRETRRLLALEIALATAAAVGGLGSLVFYRVDLMGAIAMVGFTGALGVQLYRPSAGSEERWYKGRAAAESVKSLAWLYAVRGRQFSDEDDLASSLFTARIRAVIAELRTMKLVTVDAAHSQLTTAMIELRGSTTVERRDTYCTDRVTDQITWYSRRSQEHDTSRKNWAILVIVAYGIGFVAALARTVMWTEADILGVAAATGTGILAWIQMNQYRTLTVAYSVAAQELITIRDELLRITDEEEWAHAAADAELAISREHVVWSARRGLDP